MLCWCVVVDCAMLCESLSFFCLVFLHFSSISQVAGLIQQNAKTQHNRDTHRETHNTQSFFSLKTTHPRTQSTKPTTTKTHTQPKFVPTRNKQRGITMIGALGRDVLVLCLVLLVRALDATILNGNRKLHSFTGLDNINTKSLCVVVLTLLGAVLGLMWALVRQRHQQKLEASLLLQESGQLGLNAAMSKKPLVPQYSPPEVF
eukprot:c8937_g1_i1.p1 GENE.c8937_g1_i1~~c8937_g1_i1.p1  ORF type:complete len:203 (+),score=51.54 c8937_g1_i1:39-647(+)